MAHFKAHHMKAISNMLIAHVYFQVVGRDQNQHKTSSHIPLQDHSNLPHLTPRPTGSEMHTLGGASAVDCITGAQKCNPLIAGFKLPTLLPRPTGAQTVSGTHANPVPGTKEKIPVQTAPPSGNLRKLLPRPAAHDLVLPGQPYAVSGRTDTDQFYTAPTSGNLRKLLPRPPDFQLPSHERKGKVQDVRNVVQSAMGPSLAEDEPSTVSEPTPSQPKNRKFQRNL